MSEDKRLKYNLPPTVRIVFGGLVAGLPINQETLLSIFDLIGADYDRLTELEAENAQLKAENEKLCGNALLLYRLGIGVGNGTADCKAEAKKILAEIGKELSD